MWLNCLEDVVNKKCVLNLVPNLATNMVWIAFSVNACVSL